jgi:hypothetical protein
MEKAGFDDESISPKTGHADSKSSVFAAARGFKKFAIWEQVKMQIRADATNAFNQPSFGVPQQSLGNGTPGVVFPENKFNGTQITSSTVGRRTVQLGARPSLAKCRTGI